MTNFITVDLRYQFKFKERVLDFIKSTELLDGIAKKTKSDVELYKRHHMLVPTSNFTWIGSHIGHFVRSDCRIEFYLENWVPMEDMHGEYFSSIIFSPDDMEKNGNSIYGRKLLRTAESHYYSRFAKRSTAGN